MAGDGVHEDAVGASKNSEEKSPAIQVKGLTYKFPDGSTGLKDVSFELPRGSRTLLIGANGAGKTTLLRLLSGKRLAPRNTISILSLDPFTDNLSGITYLGSEWVLNPHIRTDISVPALLSSIGGDAYPSRRDTLLRILDIDVRWRMHAVSDGERRRVQLAMGLVRPWEVLLLDEVTVDLDLVSRMGFLEWLIQEGEGRGATVVYATHIFDGLGGWATHLCHVSGGGVRRFGEVEELLKPDEESPDSEQSQKENDMTTTSAGISPLGGLVLKWLKEDLEERGPRPNQLLDGDGNVKQGTASSEQAKSYGHADGIGGYGMEKRLER